MQDVPDVLFVIDIKVEMNAVLEARKLGIPIVAIVDTNCDPELVDFARRNLRGASVANVSVEPGDGSRGWDLHAPYDVIVVSGSMPELPEALLRQLKIGGRMVAIVGEAPSMEAQRIRRTGENAFSRENLFETVAAALDKVPRREKFVF
jgi:protein-L-isoaspartate(D-aspartate) O-methyltransferase